MFHVAHYRIKSEEGIPSGGQPVLTLTDEIMLARNIAMHGDRGFPRDLFDIRVLVRQYLVARGRVVSKFSSNTPGTYWVRSFLHRQREIISQRMCRNICRKRAKITPTTVGDYFENLHMTLDGVSGCNTINYYFNSIRCKVQLNNCFDWILWCYIDKKLLL